jgi:hypothetical protein
VNRAASCAGIVRWQGWRLPFLDYEAWQRGRDLTFVLEREGDTLLVPLALNGRLGAPGQSLDGDEAIPVLDAIEALRQEGWQVVGRLHTAFVGYDSEDHFWRETLRHLGLSRDGGNRFPYLKD